MRIISFTQRWEKLNQPEFTTFRFTRKDRDWSVGEVVQVYFKSRSPQREKLGIAQIIGKELRLDGKPETDVTHEEALADGFCNVRDMENWMIKTYGRVKAWKPRNKLTLKWLPETLGGG